MDFAGSEEILSQGVALAGTALSLFLAYLTSKHRSRDQALISYQESVGKEVARLDERTERYWARIQSLEQKSGEWREKYLVLQAESQEIRNELQVVSERAEQRKNLIQMMQAREEEYRTQIQDLKAQLKSLGFDSEAIFGEPPG